MTFRPNPALARLLDLIRRTAEDPVYIVGGSLRDAMLGRPTADLDLAIEGSAERLARRLARKLNGTLVVLDEATRVYRVVLSPSSPFRPWIQIDVAQAQGKDIHADLLRRDFTINALASPIQRKGEGARRQIASHPAPLPKGERGIIDPRGGLRDLQRGAIRADRPQVFKEDPLRLLRAFRQAAQLGFAVDARTLRHIRAHRRLVRKPAGERIRNELLGITASSDAHAWLGRMDRTRLLTALFPELEKSRRCAEVYYGRGGVLRHSLDTVARMDFLLETVEESSPPAAKGGARAARAQRGLFADIAGDIRRHLELHAGSWERAKPLLRLAALLHDIAKPATARKIKGRLRFFGHDKRGAQQTAKLLDKLRFSRQETALVSACVRHHLRPGNLAANAVISDKAAFRFFRDVGNHGVPLLLVCWADHASYLSPAMLRRVLPYAGKDPHDFPLDRVRGEAVRKTLHHLQSVGYLLRGYFKRAAQVRPTPLLDGYAVMKALKIPPGPAVGRALELLQEAQAEGKVSSRAQALRFLKESREGFQGLRRG